MMTPCLFDGMNALQDDEDAIGPIADGWRFWYGRWICAICRYKRETVMTSHCLNLMIRWLDEVVWWFWAVENHPIWRRFKRDAEWIDTFALFETDQGEASNTALLGDNLAEIDDLDEFADDVDGSTVTGLESVTLNSSAEKATLGATTISMSWMMLSCWPISILRRIRAMIWSKDYLADALGVAG